VELAIIDSAFPDASDWLHDSARRELAMGDISTGRVSSAVDAATAAVVDPRHPIRQEVDQLDQKLDQHREESAKLDILPLGRSNR